LFRSSSSLPLCFLLPVPNTSVTFCYFSY
jgi:hypothetical protein